MDGTEQIKKHIAKGEPDKAIKLLLEYTKAHSPDTHDEALLLSGQYRQWKREVTLGVQQSSGELRRIEMCIMDILNDEETYKETSPRMTKLAANVANSPSTPAQKSNLMPILVGVFGTISIVFVLLLAMGSGEPQTALNETPIEEATKNENVDVPASKTVFGGGLTEDQFDKMLSSYNENVQAQNEPRLDINTVIQVRYTTGEKDGVFESVANSNEWIERRGNSNEIINRYEEQGRLDQMISIRSTTNDRSVFLSVDEDKVYARVGTGKKYHIYNIIGVY